MIFRISKPDRSLKGIVHLTASKSESNRLLIIRSLCKDHFEINNLAAAEDTQTLKQILTAASSQLRTPNSELTFDVGPAGTTMRFLAAYFATQPGVRMLTGSDRMKQRPVGILVDALKKLGASVEYAEKEGFPPIRIGGKKLDGGVVEINGNMSSQFISALLMIAPALEKGLELHLKGEITSRPYIHMTLRVMERFGIKYKWKENVISIPKQDYHYQSDKPYTVEADWSAASYYYSMAALADNVDLTITGLQKQSLQGDSVVAELYTFFGVKTEYIRDGIRLTKGKAQTIQFSYNFENCPDIAQTVAVTAAALGIPARLNGLHTLKIKETDRITALKTELGKLGVKTEITGDSIFIHPSGINLTSENLVSTYEDHRMAMAFAPLAMIGEIKIEEPGVVKKSYPGFWDDLKELEFVITKNN